MFERRPVTIISFIVLMCLSLLVTNNQPLAQAQETEPIDSPGNIMFIENVGQFDDAVRFQVRNGNSTLWITDHEVWMTVLEESTAEMVDPQSSDPITPSQNNSLRNGVNLKLTFPDSNPTPTIEPYGQLDTTISYFTGDISTTASAWRGVRYLDLYPGIDLELFGEAGDWNWRLVCETDCRSELENIRLNIEGSEALTPQSRTISASSTIGDIEIPLLQVLMPDNISAKEARISQKAQIINEQKVAFPFVFDFQSPSQARNGRQINTELLYSTFLGGSSEENFYPSIAVDATGAIYVAGSTESSNFPTTAGSSEFSGYWDVFVSKISPTGDRLVYSSFLGGSSYDYAYDIDVDSTGQIYVVGTTKSTDFPTTTNALQKSRGGDHDGFLSKFNSSGQLLYSTYLGGAERESVTKLDVDTNNIVYLTGRTDSVDFPVTSGAYDQTFNGGSNYDNTFYGDAFVTKVDTISGKNLYSTYLGGSSYEGRWGGISALASGEVIVTGITGSTDFPDTSNAHSGKADIYVVRLNTDGSDVIYSYLVGGTEDEQGNEVVTDAAGNAYVIGWSLSSDFPVTSDAYDSSFGGNSERDGVVVKISSNGDLAYATYLGGSDHDRNISITIDTNDILYIVGDTEFSDLPITSQAYQSSKRGDKDAFIAKLDLSRSGVEQLQYATYFGGTNQNYGSDIAISPNQAINIVGHTTSSNLPITADAIDSTYNNSGDVFIAKLAGGIEVPVLSADTTRLSFISHLGGGNPANRSFTIDNTGTGTLSWQVTEDIDWLTIDQTSGSNRDTINVSTDITGLAEGVYRDQLTITTADGLQSVKIIVSLLVGCQAKQAVDVILIIDTSGSMAPPYTSEQTFIDTKNASKEFIDLMDLSQDQVGIVSFEENATLQESLTQNSTEAKREIDTLPSPDGATDIVEALNKAQSELESSRHNPDNNPVIILLTDGGHNQEGNPVSTSANIRDKGTRIITIGLGDADIATLEATASAAQDYYYSPTSAELWAIYQDISLIVSCELPILQVEPTHIVFDVSDSNPVSNVFTVTNSGTGNLAWTATHNQSWLTLSSSSGTAPNVITMTINPAEVNAGSHIDTITIDAGDAKNSPQTIDVALTINPVGDSATLSGKVTDYLGNPIPNALITVEGTTTNYISGSDEMGNYNFGNLISGDEYKITITKDDYIFSPDDVTQTIFGDHKMDFIGFDDQYTIYGQVTDVDGNPVSGVEIYAASGSIHSDTTNENGKYLLKLKKASFVIKPSKPNELFFTPHTKVINLSSGPVQQDFTLLDELPLIFVPGVMGSYIYRESDDEEMWPNVRPVSDNDKLDLSLYPGYKNGTYYAPDVIRRVKFKPKNKIVYEPLLNYLHDGGFKEYQVNNEPDNRTEAGCDYEAQKNDHPNLFIFAYDWRLSNVETAEALKEYVKCVQKFYPNQNVNILTHSMGGLVARRYILDNPNDHNVNALITIAAPWLGAPKLLYVMETGKLGILLQQTLTVDEYDARKIIGSSPAGYQLLPSKAYHDLSGTNVLGLYEIDTENVTYYGDVNYDDYIAFLDERYRCSQEEGCHDQSTANQFRPGTIGAAFHNGEQDDWRNDNTGTKYYHLYGVEAENDTIKRVALKPSYCFSGFCIQRIGITYTRGDGTVPCVSATRRAGCGLSGESYNAPNAQLQLQCSEEKPFDCPEGNRFDADDDDAAEHTGMTKNPKVHDRVWKSLVDSVTPDSMRSRLVAQQEDPLPPVKEAYYLTIFGSDTVIVSDQEGNNTAPISGTILSGSVPGVSSYIVGENVTTLVMPTERLLTVTFKVLTGPIAILLDKGDAITATQVVRYVDTELPAGVTATLLFNDQGVNHLRYDNDGDNIFESVLPPTVDVSGTTAQDITPPTVAITTTSTNQVLITAQDSETGVKEIYYSLEMGNFEPYIGPLPINSTEPFTVYAFADDQNANRSSLTTYRVESNTTTTYLPLIIKEPLLPTPTPFPTITPLPGLSNGDFEQGSVGWTQYSAMGAILIFNEEQLLVPAHSGQWGVWLGGVSDEVSYIRQQVTVPFNAPYLTYWHWIASEDVCGYDFGGVGIAGTWYDQYDLCEATETNGWVPHTVDLSIYAGQTILLDIAATTDSSENSSLFIDDVSFRSSRMTAQEAEAPQHDPTIDLASPKDGVDVPVVTDVEEKGPPIDSSRYTD